MERAFWARKRQNFPSKEEVSICLGHRSAPRWSRVRVTDKGKEMERLKGFEPSTSTLARLRSTTELQPLSSGA